MLKRIILLIIFILAGCAEHELTRLEKDLLECSTKATDYCKDVRNQARKREARDRQRNTCPFGGVPVIMRGSQVGCMVLQ